MIDQVLKQKSLTVRLTVKGAITIALVILCVALPQIAHAAGGAAAGQIYLPMYAPVLLAGCLLGAGWGLCTGAIAPVISFAFTLAALGSAMPSAERLPYMIGELAMFGLISGLFCKKIAEKPLFAFPTVICAQVAGRALYFVLSCISGASAASVWQTIELGLAGLYIQAAIIPVLVILLGAAIKHERH